MDLAELKSSWSEVRAALVARDDMLMGEVVEILTPVVRRMCANHVDREPELEDLSQEVLARFLHHADRIEQGLLGWLARTARSLAAERLRRRDVERRHARPVAHHAGQVRRSTVSTRGLELIGAALGELDEPTRSLVMARYFDRLPLRVLAEREGVSLATISRRVDAGLRRMAEIAELLPGDDLDRAFRTIEPDDERLRWFIDRAHAGEKLEAFAKSRRCRPKPPATLRVGVLVSHYSTTVPQNEGFFASADQGVQSIRMLDDPVIELIALLEPDSLERPSIEVVIREYGLLDGVLDATDDEALAALDVIHIGDCFALSASVLEAVWRAVRSGVGLYKEAWFAPVVPGLNDRRILDLLMTDRAGVYHTPGEHDLPRNARVVARHPVIPGLAEGTELTVGGCGTIYEPNADARTLIMQDGRHDANTYTYRGDVSGPKPILVAGQFGRGRIVTLNQNTPEAIAGCSPHGRRFLTDVYRWVGRFGSEAESAEVLVGTGR